MNNIQAKIFLIVKSKINNIVINFEKINIYDSMK